MEKPRPHSIPERVSVMAETVRQSVMKLKAPRAQQLASVLSILVALCWGLLAGLVVCVPAGYYYRFWRESSPFRGNVDYVKSSIAGINADWDLFGRLQRQNAFLGTFSPITKLSRAASTTALVTFCRPLTSRIRSIYVSSRFSNRKLPPVIRMIAATVSGSDACRGRCTPGGVQRCSSSWRISAAHKGRNSWTNPIRE